MSMSTIRLAQMKDYESVENIMKQVQDLHINWRPDIYKECGTVLPYEEFLDAVKKEQFVVAEIKESEEAEGTVVGLLAYVIRHIASNTQVTRDVLFIDSMAIDEKYRGQGIGHQFFEYVKEIKEKNNYDGIELQVNARNVQAKEMYEKCGFTEKSINMELLL